MKNKTVNKKVLRAMSIGLAAMMAATSMPLTVLADDTAPADDANQGDQSSEVQENTQNTTEPEQALEQAANTAEKTANTAEEASKAVDSAVEKVISIDGNNISGNVANVIIVEHLETEKALKGTTDNGTVNAIVDAGKNLIDAEGTTEIQNANGHIKEINNIAEEVADAGTTADEKVGAATNVANEYKNTVEASSNAIDKIITGIETGNEAEINDLYEQAEAEVEKADKNYEDAKTKFDKAKAEAEEAVKAVKAAQEKYDKAVADASEDVEAAEKELKKAKDEAARLSKLADDAGKAVEVNLDKVVKTTEEAVSAAQTAVESAQSAKDEADKAQQAAQEKADDAKKAYDDAKDKADKADIAQKAAQDEADAAATALSKAKADELNKENEYKSAEAKLEEAKKALANATSDKASKAAAVKDAEAKVAEAKKALEEVQSVLESAKDADKKAQDALDAATAAKDSAQIVRNKALDDYQAAQEVTKGAQNTKDAADTALEAAKATLDEAQKKQGAAQGALDDIENGVLADANKALEDAKTALQKATDECSIKEKEAQSATEAVKNAQSESDAANKAANQAVSDMKNAQNKNEATAKQEMEDAEAALKEAQSVLESAQQADKKARDELAAADKEYNEASKTADLAQEEYKKAIKAYEDAEKATNSIKAVDGIENIISAIKAAEEAASKDNSAISKDDRNKATGEVSRQMVKYFVASINDNLLVNSIDIVEEAKNLLGQNYIDIKYNVVINGKTVTKNERYFYEYQKFEKNKPADFNPYTCVIYDSWRGIRNDKKLSYDGVKKQIDNYNTLCKNQAELEGKAEEALKAYNVAKDTVSQKDAIKQEKNNSASSAANELKDKANAVAEAQNNYNEKADKYAAAKIETAKINSNGSWDSKDVIFKEIVEGYYVSNVLAQGATNVKIQDPSSIDDGNNNNSIFVKFKESDAKNYALVTYEIDGETKSAKLNYKVDNSGNLIIFEKDLEGKNSAYDAYVKDKTKTDGLFFENGNEGFNKFMAASEEAIQEAKNNVAIAQNKAAEAKKALDSANKKKKLADEAVSAAQTAVESAQSAMDEADKAQQAAQKKANAAQKAYDDAKADADKADKAQQAAKDEADAAATALSNAQADESNKKNEYKSAKAKLEEAKTALEKATSDKASKAAAVKDAEAKVAEAEMALKEAQSALESAKNADKTAQDALNAATAAKDSAQTVRDKALDDYQAAQEVTKGAQKTKDAADTALEEAKATLGKAQEKQGAAQSALDIENGVLANANQALEDAKAALQKETDNYKKKANELSALRVNVAKINNSVNVLNEKHNYDSLDAIFKEIVEGYYVSNILEPGATDVRVIPAKDVKDENATNRSDYFVKFTSDYNNYALVEYKINGETKTVKLNYKPDGFENIIIFEKDENGTNAAFDAYNKDNSVTEGLFFESDEDYRAWLNSVENYAEKDLAYKNLKKGADNAANEVANAQATVELLKNALDALKTGIGNQTNLGALTTAKIGELNAKLADAVKNLEVAESKKNEIDEKLSDAKKALDERTAELDRIRREAENSGSEGTTGGEASSTGAIDTFVLADETITTPLISTTGSLAAPSGVAGVRTASGSVSANTGEEDSKLGDSAKEKANDKVADKDDNEKVSKTATIKENETPLANPLSSEEKSSMNWWWALVAAALGVTGEELFRKNQKKKLSAETVKSEKGKES